LSLRTVRKLKLYRMFPVHNPEADDDDDDDDDCDYVSVCLLLNA
jgi:hypothetical protein